jgi:hypothetical protein
LQPRKAGFYSAFSLDTVRKVLRRVEKDKNARKIDIHSSGHNEIFDVDSVKIGVEKALKELETNDNLKTT